MQSEPLYSRPVVRRQPIGLVLAVVLAALILVGAIVGWAIWQFSLLPAGVALVLRIALFSLPIGAAIVGLCIAWRRWGSHRYIEAYHVTQLTRAQAQRFPAALQHLSYSDHSRPQLAAPVGEEVHAPPEIGPPGVPSFGELIDQGKIGPARPLILGYNVETGAAIEGSWFDLYSCGVGGMTGSGKSWLVAFLAGQSAAAGARIILIDPHAGDPQSLATRLAPLSASFMCDVASTPTEITSALKLASDKLESRKAGKGGVWPLLLICDEWVSMLRVAKIADLLTATALAFAEEGRKYGSFAILASQGWQVEAAGPVRDRLASHFTMRTRGDQFRYQMGLRGSAPLDTLFLKPGQAYFLSTRGELGKVIIPQMEPADLARCATLIDRPAAAVGSPFGFHVPATAPLPMTPAARASEAGTKPVRSGLEAAPEAASTASERCALISPEAARVYAAWQGGRDVTDLAKEANGGSASGENYKKALRQINDLLRQAMKGE